MADGKRDASLFIQSQQHLSIMNQLHQQQPHPYQSIATAARHPSSITIPPRQIPTIRTMHKPIPGTLPFRPGNRGAVARRDDDWSTWPELRLRITQLPSNITTHDLWVCFSQHGSVIQIEIMEDSHGVRDGVARVTFG